MNFNKKAFTIYFDLTSGATGDIINDSLKKLLKLTKLKLEINISEFKKNWINNYKCSDICYLKKSKNFIIKYSTFKTQTNSLAIKILGILYKSLSKSNTDKSILPKKNEFSNLKKIIIFSHLISRLNPISVNSSKIPLSWENIKSLNMKDKYVNEKSWILELIKDTPTLEQNWPAPYSDPVGIAMIKAVSSEFGSRGESILKEIGLGETKKSKLFCRAIICVPENIKTRIIDIANHKNETIKLFKLEAMLKKQSKIYDLINLINKENIIEVFFSQIFDLNGPRNLITIYLNKADLQKIIEILFSSKNINFLNYREHQGEKLEKKLLAIPYGDGKKINSCKLIEFYFNNKLIKMEIDEFDMIAIENHTKKTRKEIKDKIIQKWKNWRNIKE